MTSRAAFSHREAGTSSGRAVSKTPEFVKASDAAGKSAESRGKRHFLFCANPSLSNSRRTFSSAGEGASSRGCRFKKIESTFGRGQKTSGGNPRPRETSKDKPKRTGREPAPPLPAAFSAISFCRRICAPKRGRPGRRPRKGPEIT